MKPLALLIGAILSFGCASARAGVIEISDPRFIVSATNNTYAFADDLIVDFSQAITIVSCCASPGPGGFRGMISPTNNMRAILNWAPLPPPLPFQAGLKRGDTVRFTIDAPAGTMIKDVTWSFGAASAIQMGGYSITQVPEPSEWVLLLLGALPMTVLIRRRQKHASRLSERGALQSC